MIGQYSWPPAFRLIKNCASRTDNVCDCQWKVTGCARNSSLG